MREILFRGKLVVNGEWLSGGFHSRFDRAFIIGCSKSFRIDGMDVIPETVGQFTGLTDKNGKKIFEGDILQTEDRIVVVVWHEPSGSWDTKFVKYISEDRWAGILNSQWRRYATVIGNIHDNPELLEG